MGSQPRLSPAGWVSPRAAFAHLCQLAQLTLVLRVRSRMASALWMLQDMQTGKAIHGSQKPGGKGQS